MPEDAVSAVRVRRVAASPKSSWIMVEVETASSAIGAGEASLHFDEAAVCRAALAFEEDLAGLRLTAALDRLSVRLDDDLVRASAICALDQAIHDLMGQQSGRSIAEMFAEAPRAEVEVYANINRRTLDRSPGGFADSARRALAANYSALKIAPFDALKPEMTTGEAAPLLSVGFERIRAVRDAIGAGRRLLVDCHWRLPDHALQSVIDECAVAGVYWLETPFAEDGARHGDIRRARALANDKGPRLAGGELKVGRAAFEALIAAGCYDVLMPDMKYVGGYREYFAVCDAAARAGVLISPHNPTGPIGHAHSVQASAGTEPFLILEMQFDETPLFTSLVEGELPLPRDGVATTPRASGLGLRLASAATAA